MWDYCFSFVLGVQSSITFIKILPFVLGLFFIMMGHRVKANAGRRGRRTKTDPVMGNSDCSMDEGDDAKSGRTTRKGSGGSEVYVLGRSKKPYLL